MPVHGLWDALRSRGLLEEAKNGEELRQLLQGKKVAVDLSIWAVEGQERSLQIEAKGGKIWQNYTSSCVSTFQGLGFASGASLYH